MLERRQTFSNFIFQSELENRLETRVREKHVDPQPGMGTVPYRTLPSRVFFEKKKTVGFVHGFAVYLGSSAILGRSASSKAKCKIFATIVCMHWTSCANSVETECSNVFQNRHLTISSEWKHQKARESNRQEILPGVCHWVS